jgi:ABC-type amino acid transport substrate-binding protein
LSPVSSRTTLEGIRQRGILRVGYLSDNVPYGYLNDKQRLVGFDVEMAHKLARDLGVPLQLVLIERGTIVARLADGSCDVMMAGVVVTADAAERVRFSKPYLDETLAFVVQDHLREEYSTWDSIRHKPRPRIAAVNLPYYVAKIRLELPQAEIVPVESIAKAFEINPDSIDAILATAERGSAWTLLHPGYSVAVPQPRIIRVPLAYAVSRNDRDMAAFLDTWIDLKARDGTIERLYAHWILGRHQTAKTPRWSVIRNVLHWVD